MIVTFTPKGQQPQRFAYDSGDVRAKDAERIEAKAGVPWDQFELQILQGSIKARRVLLWHLQRQDHPALRLDDVDFAAKELKVEFNADELGAVRDTLLKNTAQLGEDVRDAALAMIDAQIAEAGAPEGKAPSETSDAPTA